VGKGVAVDVGGRGEDVGVAVGTGGSDEQETRNRRKKILMIRKVRECRWFCMGCILTEMKLFLKLPWS
jgi:hypothetical protein